MSKEKVSKPQAINFLKDLWKHCPFLTNAVAHIDQILKTFETFYSNDGLKKFNINLTKHDGTPNVSFIFEKESKRKIYLIKNFHKENPET